MKKFSIIFLLLISLLLPSCKKEVDLITYNDYAFTMDYKVDFKILQCNDIHFGVSTDMESEFLYLEKVIKQASPDLIVFNGDFFMNATKSVVKNTLRTIDSFNIPWTITFGNHDKQGYYSPQYLLNQLEDESLKNLLFRNIHDDVYGDSNYFINLVNPIDETQILWQIICLDSNSYYYTGLFQYGYDVLHDDQIEFYRDVVVKTAEKNGAIVPSVAFFHIPMEEFYEASAEYGETFDRDDIGYRAEPSSIGYKENDFFESVKELGSTKAIFCAHDHINGFTIPYEGVLLSYGVKTGQELYHDNDHIGGQIITLHMDGTVECERMYVNYEK